MINIAESNRLTKDLTPRERSWLAVFQRVEELRRLHEESAKDVDEMVQLLRKQHSSQTVRRTLIRNIAAHVEGFLFGLKHVTLALSGLSRAAFTRRDLARLAEENSYQHESGQEERLRFDDFITNLKFAVKCYARVNGFAFVLDCNDQRYCYFREMVRVRNRLKHPKSLESFAVSDEEIIRIGKAHNWFSDQATRLLKGHALAGQFGKFARTGRLDFWAPHLQSTFTPESCPIRCRRLNLSRRRPGWS